MFHKIPYPIRTALRYTKAKIIPPYKKHSKGLIEHYKLIDESQWWTEEKLRSYQLSKLKRLLNYSYHHVPYYHRLFDELKLKPESIKKIEDLDKLPILTKKDIRNNTQDLIGDNWNKQKLIASHTSGSTGVPLEFFIDANSSERENAFMFRAWSFGGYSIGDKVVMLRSFVPKENEPLFYQDWQNQYLYLSAYHLSEEVMRNYISMINRFGASILRGYPSSIFILANFLRENRIKLPQIKTIITSSETLLPHYREEIEKAFETKVLDWYGYNERGITLQQCEINDGYHTNLEYGVLEVVDFNGRPVKRGRGRIIATNLDNYIMPLIRYDAGDIGIKRSDTVCKCGRGLPLDIEKIEGRSDEILSFKDKMIPPINFYTMFHEIPNIIQFQLIQNAPMSLEVKLIVNRKFDKSNERAVIDGLANRVGQSVRISLNKVKEIQRDPVTGKIRSILGYHGKK